MIPFTHSEGVSDPFLTSTQDQGVSDPFSDLCGVSDTFLSEPAPTPDKDHNSFKCSNMKANLICDPDIVTSTNDRSDVSESKSQSRGVSHTLSQHCGVSHTFLSQQNPTHAFLDTSVTHSTNNIL